MMIAAKPQRMQKMKLEILKVRRASGAVIAAAALGMAACASAPIPNDRLAVAHDSVQRAERSGAPELAPVQLASAKEKLNRAENAAAHHDALPTEQLADQANVDAQLAEAMANQQKSHKAAMDFDSSMQALRQESMRSTQPAVPVVPAQSLPPST
jgi:Domain of unknown function (DUF4398)